MKEKLTALFQPYVLNNGVEISNRLVVAPMTHFASNPDGTLSEQEQRFLSNRAEKYWLVYYSGNPCGRGWESLCRAT